MSRTYSSIFFSMLLILAGLISLPGYNANANTDSARLPDDSTVPVTVDNFVRAETAFSFARTLAISGANTA